MGTMQTETIGTITFNDFKNNIKAELTIGKVKKKPSDYFEGNIKLNNNIISKIYGSYMGFVEIDGKRYWDFRDHAPFKRKVA